MISDGVLPISSWRRKTLKEKFKNLFSGRINRLEFLIAGLLYGLALIIMVFIYIITLFVFGEDLSYINGAYFTFIIIFTLIFLFFNLVLIPSVVVRRAHDFGVDGVTAIILNFFPIINIIFLIILLFKKGDDSANKYGEVIKRDIKGILLNKY